MEGIIFKHYLEDSGIEYEQNVAMSERTWIHRGPIVPFLIFPKTRLQLKDVILFLEEKKSNYKVIGHTSNLYFKPSFVTEVIVSTNKMTSYHDDGNAIICDSGVNISRLSQYAVSRGYLGFEGMVGLPGTIGAAVVNNSSCFKCSVSDLVESVDVLESGELHTLSHDELSFKHRSSAIKRGERNAIILGIKLKIQKTDDIEGLKKQAQQNVELRKQTQEGKAKNLGSIFSGYHPRPIDISLLGWQKVIGVLTFRVRDHFLRNNATYKLKRNKYLFKLFGYKDLEKYVSDKNINCFIWRDEYADVAFDRYLDFMNHYADCDSLEIEILK